MPLALGLDNRALTPLRWRATPHLPASLGPKARLSSGLTNCGCPALHLGRRAAEDWPKNGRRELHAMLGVRDPLLGHANRFVDVAQAACAQPVGERIVLFLGHVVARRAKGR